MSMRALLGGITLLALAACAAPATTRYYTLAGAAPPAPAARESAIYSVAIGPATVPEALDRMQLVLRVAPDRYEIADAEYWSTPLKREIPPVIAGEVGMRLPEARVAAYVQHGGQDADYRVLIDVLRFDAAPGATVTLEAAWTVRNRAGLRLAAAQSTFVEAVDAPGFAPLVSAHRKALAALGHEIAAAVKALARANR